jgi:hypothetical protein
MLLFRRSNNDWTTKPQRLAYNCFQEGDLDLYRQLNQARDLETQSSNPTLGLNFSLEF